MALAALRVQAALVAPVARRVVPATVAQVVLVARVPLAALVAPPHAPQIEHSPVCVKMRSSYCVSPTFAIRGSMYGSLMAACRHVEGHEPLQR